MRTASGTTTSDAPLIDLLRVEGPLGIAAISRHLGVTATAVRQRLDRLMAAGLIVRDRMPSGENGRTRGRPSHAYSLTDRGRHSGGDNFRDLALVLWQEIRGVKEAAVRQGLIGRIGAAMAGMYRDRVSGDSPRERLESIADILRERRVSCSVEAGDLPVLTSHSCPYPDLAEQDRGICAAERVMFENLVGGTVRLSECRLDGGCSCRFTAHAPTTCETVP